MRYIKEVPFLDRKGQQVVLSLELPATKSSKATKEPTVGRMLLFFLDAYEPTQELRISPSEMKNKVWPALDVLEKGPNERGYYVFENEPFETMKRVVMFYVERLQGLQIAKHSPIFMDLFEKAGSSSDPTALEPM